MKYSSPKTQTAFTLIELLVVISIIAILAGIALPVFGQVQIKGAQTKTLSNAKQIGLACRLFADDYNGLFPTAKLDESTGKLGNSDVGDSNEAFAQLFTSGYLQTEQIFFVPKSAFTPKPPDEQFKNTTQCLSSGENHFAYVLNVTTTSPATWPLLADGFTSEGEHNYSEKESDKGGVWKGLKAIVIRADNSGSIEKLTPRRFKVPGNPNGDDLFSTTASDWMSAKNKSVNPK